MGQQIPVTVDTQVLWKYGRPKFAAPNETSSSFWAVILEKAFAKAAGSYSAIVSGSSDCALHALTNNWGQVLTMEKEEVREQLRDGRLWRFLVDFYNSGGFLCAGTSGMRAVKDLGLVEGHAYALLDVKLVGGRHKLLCLRNPWAHQEWNGAWSDHSSEWTPELRKEVKLESGDDGLFWMCFDDFSRYFRSIYCCSNCEGWNRWDLKGTVGPENVAIEDRDQWLFRWPEGKSSVTFRWAIETDKLGGISARFQRQDGKRVKGIYVGYPTIHGLQTATNGTFGGGIKEVTEDLDKVWTMVIESFADFDIEYIFSIWCQEDLHITPTTR
jgi:hypothetical protein